MYVGIATYEIIFYEEHSVRENRILFFLYSTLFNPK